MGYDPFAEFFKKAQQKAYNTQSQYTQTGTRGNHRKSYVYRDRYGNEYIVEENINASRNNNRKNTRDFFKYRNSYRSRRRSENNFKSGTSLDYETTNWLFKDFYEGLRNSDSVFNSIFNEQTGKERTKWEDERENRRQEMAQAVYDNLNVKEAKLKEDLQRQVGELEKFGMCFDIRLKRKGF